MFAISFRTLLKISRNMNSVGFNIDVFNMSYREILAMLLRISDNSIALLWGTLPSTFEDFVFYNGQLASNTACTCKNSVLCSFFTSIFCFWLFIQVCFFFALYPLSFYIHFCCFISNSYIQLFILLNKGSSRDIAVSVKFSEVGTAMLDYYKFTTCVALLFANKGLVCLR